MNAKQTHLIRDYTIRTDKKVHNSPVFLNSSFVFDSAEEASNLFSGKEDGNIYSRYSNPNIDEFIAKLCLLENAESGLSANSGMAALYTVLLALLQQGDHVVASKHIFGNNRYVLSEMISRFGIECTFVDIHDTAAWEEAILPITKLFFVETPANPTLEIADLSFLGSLAKNKGIHLVVDNTFATPILQNPLDFGAEIVIHSATKYLDGQGRVLGGAILGKPALIERCYQHQKKSGTILSPFNAWVLSHSLSTLPLRMERHCDNADKVFEFLKMRNGIEKVFFPFDEEGVNYSIAKEQMKRGGGLIGFTLDADLEGTKNVLDNLKLFSITANLGDVKSIATHPASTTHSSLTNEEQLQQGIRPNYIRLSIGLEEVEDLIKDLDQAIN